MFYYHRNNGIPNNHMDQENNLQYPMNIQWVNKMVQFVLHLKLNRIENFKLVNLFSALSSMNSGVSPNFMLLAMDLVVDTSLRSLNHKSIAWLWILTLYFTAIVSFIQEECIVFLLCVQIEKHNDFGKETCEQWKISS